MNTVVDRTTSQPSNNTLQFAQELLSTFSTSLGEVALQPSTGGIFIVEITYNQADPATDALKVQNKVLWDRKTDGGFPETKELKRRVRDVIQPGRDLGHVDRDYGKANAVAGEVKPAEGGAAETETGTARKCEDCQ